MMSFLGRRFCGFGCFRCLPLLLLFTVASIASPASVAAVKVDLFWDSMDRQAWHAYFLVDAARKRMADNLDIRVTCLVDKSGDGSWKSSRGPQGLEESMRMAVLQQFYPKHFWNYLTGRSLNSWEDGWRDAARFAGIDPGKLEKKVKIKGKTLLAGHWEYSQKHKVERSRSTVFIAGKPYTGQLALMPFIKALNSNLPKNKRLAIPASAPAKDLQSPKFWIVVSSPLAQEDKRLTSAIAGTFAGISPKIIDHDSPGASVFADMGLDFLPAYILEDTALSRSTLRQAIEKGVFSSKNGYLVFTGKGSQGLFINRPKEKNTLELFTMSQCPFGVQAENSLIEAIKKKLVPDKIKLRIHYIADVTGSGTERNFRSLHGPAEWEENARQLLIRDRYPDKLFDYLLERNKNPKSSIWQTAAGKVGIDPEVITREFEKGKELLARDLKIADELGISSSPTFLWEGRILISGLSGLKKIPGFEKVPVKDSSGSCE